MNKPQQTIEAPHWNGQLSMSQTFWCWHLWCTVSSAKYKWSTTIKDRTMLMTFRGTVDTQELIQLTIQGSNKWAIFPHLRRHPIVKSFHYFFRNGQLLITYALINVTVHYFCVIMCPLHTPQQNNIILRGLVFIIFQEWADTQTFSYT